MGRNKLLVGGIVLVALIVIAYFAFVYPPPSKEDTSGAIGVAKKYRGEQIADKDVMLQEQEAAAKEFDRATPEDQVGMLERSPNVLAGAITRASADFQAKLYREVATAEDRARMLERLDPNMQAAVAKSVGMTMDEFGRRAAKRKLEIILEKAPVATLAQIVKFAEAKDQCSLFGKATQDMQRVIVSSLDPAEKGAIMMGRGPTGLYERAGQQQMERSTQAQ
jgi:hypothetical protein